MRLYTMSSMIFDGAVINRLIEASSTSYGVTTDIRFVDAPYSDMRIDSTTFTDADPEPCFG